MVAQEAEVAAVRAKAVAVGNAGQHKELANTAREGPKEAGATVEAGATKDVREQDASSAAKPKEKRNEPVDEEDKATGEEDKATGEEDKATGEKDKAADKKAAAGFAA